jgi:hypothetical protein
MKMWSLLLVAGLAASSARAAEYQFKSGEPVAVRPEDAYLLVRTFPTADSGLRGTARYSPILIRELSDEELNKVRPIFDKDPFKLRPDVEPNVVQPNAKKPFAVANDAEFLLISVKPGTYVLGGVSVTTWELKDGGVAVTCLCMGTVKFEAKPGVVTDLGAIVLSRDDRPTDVPGSAQAVSGKPWGFGGAPPKVVVRSATADTPLPDGLTQTKVVPAPYVPVGDIPNYIGAPISRLMPMRDVLSYDEKGQVTRSTGTDANPRHDGPTLK